MRAAVLSLVLLVLPAPAAAQCEVTGVASLERLRVRLPGQRLRTLAVHDVPIAVRPGRGNRYRDVRVLAPVTFSARTDGRIPWTVPRPGTASDGMLWWTPAVDVEEVLEEGAPEAGAPQDGGGSLVVRAQVDNGVWISRLHVPCSALALGHGEGGAEAPDWGLAAGPRWQPRREDLYLTRDPGEGASVRLDAPGGLMTPLVELERRGAYVRVAARFGSGAVLRGWALAPQLRRVPPPEQGATPYQRSRAHTRVPTCGRGAPDAGEYVGPAHIATGALIHVQPDGLPWASVSEPAVFTVSWRTGSDWVRVIHVPGLLDDGRCPDVLRRAWVPRRAVSLTGEGRMQGSVPAILLGIE